MKWRRETSLVKPGLGLITWVLASSSGTEAFVRRKCSLVRGFLFGGWADKGWAITIDRPQGVMGFATHEPDLALAKERAEALSLSPGQRLALLSTEHEDEGA